MSAPLDRLAAALSDRYRIERELGQGGMATVYLAEDLKHKRRVAVKVLKPELAAVLGAERFVQEITTTAALQHPHILPLFDSGTAEGFLYYVMPFIDGETLRGKLDRETQLGVDEAVRITTDVADALHYAHTQGVIHRDIKPENILIHNGRPMVADFGIALAVSAAAGGRMTETGLSLGTPHYMSPEQATAEKEITARSDVYSLASVLYEMLTGSPPHTGASAQQIIMKIVTEEAAPVTKLRKAVPGNVAAAVAKALEKLPADRFESAAAFAAALSDRGFTTATTAALAGAGHRPDRWRVIAIGALSVAALLLTATLWLSYRSGAPAVPAHHAVQFALQLPPDVSLPPPGASTSFAVSPDGGTVVFLGSRGGDAATPRIFVRTLSDQAVHELPGTEGASFMFFAPDGRSVGIAMSGRLLRLDLSGGGPATIVPALGSVFGGATWGGDDVILFSRGASAGLWRVSAGGGEPQPATVLDSVRGDVAHAWPHFLPDGRTFVFTIYRPNSTSLAVGTLDGHIEELGQPGIGPQFVSGSGHLLFSTAEGSLVAARFDLARGRFTGAPALIADDVRGAGHWASSPTGTLVIDRGSSSSRLVLVDRAGRVEPLSMESRDFRLPRVSPDGQRITVQVSGTGEGGIWIHDRRTGTLGRFTPSGAYSDAIWTPDGRRLAFAAMGAQSNVDIFWQAADGSGAPEPAVTGAGNQWPWSWTPDERTLVYDEIVSGNPTRIMAVDVGSDGPSRVVVGSPEATNRLPSVSPDGRWLTYASNETGRWEVYVRPFAGAGGKQQISAGGGNQPAWSRDGRELFYRDGARLIAAALEFGEDVRVLVRTALFEDVFSMSNATNYDVLPDGSGFVMLQPVEAARQLTVMVNWLDELRRRAGEGPQAP
ncbi:MAG: protein kinase [Gemmatimonadales bacterium]